MNKKGSPRQIKILYIFILCFAVIMLRLFQLQIINHSEYIAKANKQHLRSITLPAQRGEIISTDHHSGQFTKLATNTTLDMVYIDPYWVDNPIDVVQNLTPILYQSYCSPLISFLKPENIQECAKIIHEFVRKQYREEEIHTEDSLKKLISDYLREIVERKEVTSSFIGTIGDIEIVNALISENVEGIFNLDNNFYINPLLVRNIDNVVKELRPYFPEIDPEIIRSRATRRPLRYVRLARRLDPEISLLIRELNLKGIVLVPEYWRFYPEKEVASQIIGFVDHEGRGTYGVEEYFNDILSGKEGTITTENDPFGRNITSSSSNIRQALNGADVYLTLDRIIQEKVEEYLKESVEEYDANSAMAIVLEVGTGKIISIANYPHFDPNLFGNVYKTEIVDKHPEKKALIKQALPDNKFEIYQNKIGPGAYQNRAVTDSYEPGSIFKPFTVGIGMDLGLIEPTTEYYDSGLLEVDDFKIENIDSKCLGPSNVLRALIYSCNIGMSMISEKIGKRIFYSYMKDLGLIEKTGIKLPQESSGNVKYFRWWSDARLFTSSFGQGLTSTILQIAKGYQTIANNGISMKPYIIEKIEYPNGQQEVFTPQIENRVFKKDTSDILTSMLVEVIDEPTNKKAQVPGYFVAGKTGTSQIASRFGGYEEGEGSTITSFAGFLPAFNPKFIVITRIDRPRTQEFGSQTAAPLFSKIGKFLMTYYNIEPDIK